MCPKFKLSFFKVKVHSVGLWFNKFQATFTEYDGVVQESHSPKVTSHYVVLILLQAQDLVQ